MNIFMFLVHLCCCEKKVCSAAWPQHRILKGYVSEAHRAAPAVRRGRKGIWIRPTWWAPDDRADQQGALCLLSCNFHVYGCGCWSGYRA